MATYRVDYGEGFVFEAQGIGEVVPELQSRHICRGGDERKFMRRLAIELCEWSGCHFDWSSRESLGRSMVSAGLLRLVD